MQKKYEAPELKIIGQAEEVVMGMGLYGCDAVEEIAPDFEFEQD